MTTSEESIEAATRPAPTIKQDKNGGDSIPQMASSQVADQAGRWYLRVDIGQWKLRSLFDPGAARTIVGKTGIGIANSLGAKILPAES